VWSDGFHRVRTPLVVRVTNLPDDGVRAAAAAAGATGDHHDDSDGGTDDLQAA
jgi:hypothetical protein